MLTEPFSKIDLGWLASGEGDEDGAKQPRTLIPLVSQVRIRRNIDGYPFVSRCDNSQLYDIAATILSRISESGVWSECDSRMIDNLGEAPKNLLLEKRLISPDFMRGGAGRFFVRDSDGTVACMINEADHLTISVSLGGLAPRGAHEAASALEGALGLQYAEDPVLGYLTADPSCVGTGMQASVLLHLPAIEITGGLKRNQLALERDWSKTALSKFTQITSKPAGSFYMLSNKITLAISPAEIVSMIQGAAELLISNELAVRRRLKQKRDDKLIDRFWRAWGTLRHARRLTLEESLAGLSLVKLGSEMGYLPLLRHDEWKRIFIASQPYHLGAESQSIPEESEELSLRAALFRRFIENRSIA